MSNTDSNRQQGPGRPGNTGGGAFGGGPRGPGAISVGEKPKDFKKTWGKLIRYCKSYMPIIIMAILFAIAGSAITIYGPGKLSEITDLITAGITGAIDLGAIGNIAVLLLSLYLVGAFLSYLQTFIMATVTQKVTKRLRTSVSQKINKLPLSYFDSTSIGDVLSRVTNDIDTIGMTLNQSIGTMISSTALFVGSLIMMFATNWIMAIVAVLSTFIGFAVMMTIVRKTQKHFLAQQRGIGKINGHIEEIYSGHNVVKVYNGVEPAKEKFDKMNKELEVSVWKSQFLSGMMMPLMQFIGNLGYVLVCVTGAVLVLNNVISFGVIVAFMVYIRLFTQPLAQFAQVATNMQSTAAAGERVFELLELEELEDESHKTTTLENVKGDVEFENVKFGYSKDKIIINDFSAKVKAGEKIAIVGPTGAGKTTMVNLLMRFYEINSGQIKIDGIPISELTRENVHDLFCMVLQDTWIFDGTIKENIIYSKKGVTDKEVEDACKAVGLDHFIRTLPNGYDTVLDDKTSLSAGQKQLVTIARAMVENAPMLILDEATSSVDTRTEVLIQQAMDKLIVGRTSFIIAHRLSTIKNADVILVMKDGDIIESGTHDELLSKDGFYAQLYNSQFEKVS